MNSQEFSLFINKIIEKLYESEQKFNIFKEKDLATFSEEIIYNISIEILNKDKTQCQVNYSKGGHQFPDITYTFSSGESFGIEVKSSKSSGNGWSINGNSILGKTSIKVIDTYIIFVKYNHNGLKIKAKRYEDSISDIVVTHSPRYKIDLSIANEETFFARSGISYIELNNSDDPIRLIVDYFCSQGETAWWLPNETMEKVSPAVISSLSEFKQRYPKLIDDIYGKAYVLFPEILFYSSNQHKYNNLAKWLMANYSIADASLRDKFSAGGKKHIEIHDFVSTYAYPRIIFNLQLNINSVKKAFNTVSRGQLKLYWPQYFVSNDNVIERQNYWIKTILSDWKPSVEIYGNKYYQELELILNKLINQVSK